MAEFTRESKNIIVSLPGDKENKNTIQLSEVTEMMNTFGECKTLNELQKLEVDIQNKYSNKVKPGVIGIFNVNKLILRHDLAPLAIAYAKENATSDKYKYVEVDTHIRNYLKAIGSDIRF